MVWRIWGFLTLVLVAGAWILMVPFSPPPATKTASLLGAYRDKGLLPQAGELILSEEGGHEIFEIPASDAEEREKAMAAMVDQMPGMAREQMEAGGAGAEEDAHALVIPDDDESGEDAHTIMIPDDDEEPAEHAEVAGGAQGAAGHGADQQDGGHGGGSVEVGLTVLARGSAEEVAQIMRGRSIDRSVTIEMHEWGYSSDHVMVEPGEVIRFAVKNTGALPHEFMLMDGVGMEAVNYRLERADWTLLEHEAIYENPVVMPGRSFELVVKIHKPGMWMYMCMFPYHMQLGMMGMLMTAGVSMGGAPAGPAPEGLYHGVGVVIEVMRDESRLVLDHEDIEGYMGAMKMSYMVTSAALLEGVNPGDKVRFTIDADKRAIVDVSPYDR